MLVILFRPQYVQCQILLLWSSYLILNKMPVSYVLNKDPQSIHSSCTSGSWWPHRSPETNKTNGGINCVNTYNNMYEATYWIRCVKQLPYLMCLYISSDMIHCVMKLKLWQNLLGYYGVTFDTCIGGLLIFGVLVDTSLWAQLRSK